MRIIVLLAIIAIVLAIRGYQKWNYRNSTPEEQARLRKKHPENYRNL